jgi:dihydrofolate reductase
MTNLVNTLPESTFGDVLTTTNNGQGLPMTTPVPLQDGLGNNSPITMSQTIFNVNNTGPFQFQINGVTLLATPASLNYVTSLFQTATLIISNNTYETIATFPLSPYDSSQEHYISVQINEIYVSRSSTSIDNFGSLTNPTNFSARQTSSGIEILGGGPIALSFFGLTDPVVQIVASGNNVLIQVEEPSSSVNSTLWRMTYSVISEA